MPIEVIRGADALARRKTNDFAHWPSREDPDNRVEPIASPSFKASVQFRKGESIFTIGSCFARNIEQFLAERGFDLPARDLFKRPEFAGVPDSVLNNYGVSSIRQELAWALEPETMPDPSAAIAEVQPGRYLDLRLAAGFRPDARDRVALRRQALVESNRSIRSCRAVVITLGLAEVWYDRTNDFYLAETPPKVLVRREPDRFELRVLSYDEIERELEETVRLVLRHATLDTQIILSVSPVPMNTTFRDLDVMVANTYSKSVLRAAAEVVTARHDCVHYFPSYESVMLSDRQRAWREDLIHVAPELVETNVMRFIERYVADADAAAERAIALPVAFAALRAKGPRYQWNLLSERRNELPAHPELALVYGRLAIGRRAFSDAEWARDQLPAAVAPFNRETLQAELELGEGKLDACRRTLDALEALAAGTAAAERVRRASARLRCLLELSARRPAAAVDAAMDWIRLGAARQPVFLVLARGFRDARDYERARHFFLEARAAAEDVDVMAEIDLAEALLRLGKEEEAAAVLADVTPSTPAEQRRHALVSAFSTFSGAPLVDSDGSTGS